MRKLSLFASLCILASSLALSAPAQADVSASVRLNTGGSTIYFDNQPDVVMVPGTRVYYSPYGSDDVYRYRGSWYVYRGGMWYRASNYRGPFVYVRRSRVPYQIMNVPSDWRDRYRADWRNNHPDWQNENDQGHHHHHR